MSTYTVILTRDVTESVVMRVTAANEEEAEDNALRALNESETAEWAIDEGSWNNSDIYVTDVTEET